MSGSDQERSMEALRKSFAVTSPAGVETVHSNTYPTISPTRPELSQAGRTILITGGSAGIGFGTARSYAKASASRIILTGRRRNVVEKAAADLVVEFPKTKFVARTSDMAHSDDTTALWADLAVTCVSVDVLVLNAASMGSSEPIISADVDGLWSEFVTNVRSQLAFAHHFRAQEGFEEKKRNLVYLASAVTHMPGMEVAVPAYFLTKTVGQLLLQTIADAADPQKLQVNIFHPGTILSEGAMNAGMTADSLPFDDIKLPSDYGVWAATKEAEFLHGKFVWAGWDMDELRSEESQRQFERNPRHLSIRLVGI
ncbi:conserved hypothetical protein [Verticillium alfalfae VaMs.102]|uniref:Uncharacterized protein n=1 Tax=Verticillium alfalfae (strain VaMs.102 / ATCC MYA-4576 / FGSC 10136) TaxID=526221 RepID=C9SKU2_VERA1|nr:conserved hypothetical protein [Verticillium alfalfae VaMs.102]EEY19310.1 conserved hypothetical protein [Verticillium alfalfae VaMs.102]